MRTWRSLSRGQRLGLAGGVCGLVLIAVLMAAGAPGRSAPAPPAAAKSFTLRALGRGGRDISLGQYAGRAVVVNFFASWCGPCKRETPRLARFYQAHHGQVAVVGIDVNDPAAAALRFVRAAGVRYPVAADPTATAAGRYGVAGIPQTFFLDARHLIVKRVFGAVTPAELSAGLARMR